MSNLVPERTPSQTVRAITQIRQEAGEDFKTLAKPEILRFEIILGKIDYESKAAAAELLILLNTIEFNIVTVESLTAGKIASTFADIPSYASSIYGGFVVYDSDAKREFVDVTVKSVYNQKCAKQMAEGALRKSRAMCALAVTGQAGGYDYTDDIYLGYVDTAFSYRDLDKSGGIVLKTFTKRIKFCNNKDIDESCKEYKRRLLILRTKQNDLSPGGQPLTDNLYQIRQIIRTACVRDAILFAHKTLTENGLDNKQITDNLKGKVFDISVRDKNLKFCGEPSKFIKKYMKGDTDTILDNQNKWPNKFGSPKPEDDTISGTENDNQYDEFCNQQDWNAEETTVSVPNGTAANSAAAAASASASADPNSTVGGSRIKNKNNKLKLKKTKKQKMHNTFS
jgi:nicotinamide-nucleotide amidase